MKKKNNNPHLGPGELMKSRAEIVQPHQKPNERDEDDAGDDDEQTTAVTLVLVP